MNEMISNKKVNIKTNKIKQRAELKIFQCTTS